MHNFLWYFMEWKIKRNEDNSLQFNNLVPRINLELKLVFFI